MDDEALELETRRELYDLVRKFPGLHMREIHRELGLSIALAEYHLGVLERSGLVTSVTEEGYKRFYPAPQEGGRGLGGRERRMLGVLRQTIPLRITLMLLKQGRVSNKEMSERLGLTPSRLSFHLKKLMKAGVVRRLSRTEGRAYELEDPELVLRLVVAYRPPPDVLDECDDLWQELGL